MTPSLIDGLSGGPRDVRRAAALVASACVLQVAESLLPHPIPGVRLGLANMVTLVTLAELGMPAAIEVALLRTVVGSLVLGTFLTPGFILSFCGAAASTLVMWALWRFSSRFPAVGPSVVGISMASAVVHNASQLFLAYLIMMRDTSVFYFIPWLVISGVVMGWLTGLVAAEVIRSGGGAYALSGGGLASQDDRPSSSGAFFSRLSPGARMALALAALLLAVFTGRPGGFLLLAAGLLAVMLATRQPAASYRLLFKRLRKLAWLASVSFFFPLFFDRGGAVIFSAGPLMATRAGLAAGSVFAMRIAVMGWIAFLLNLYSTPSEIAAGISALGRPFRRFGFPADRIGAVITMAWGEIPAFSSRAREAVNSVLSGAGRTGWRREPLRWLVRLTAAVVARMCRPGEQDAAGTAAA